MLKGLHDVPIIFGRGKKIDLSGICEPGHWPHQPPPSDRQPAPEVNHLVMVMVMVVSRLQGTTSPRFKVDDVGSISNSFVC